MAYVVLQRVSAVVVLKLYVCRNNKIVLKALHYPITATAYQFFLGSIMGLLWFAASGTKIDTSKETVTAVAPLALVHTLGNLLTNVSLGMVAVSFTHTIKALEPMFSVLFSFLFLGESPNPIVLLTLLPIMGGVIGAAVSEVSFNWVGFGSAMASNATFQSRNVFSKKVMTPQIKERVQLLSTLPVHTPPEHVSLAAFSIHHVVHDLRILLHCNEQQPRLVFQPYDNLHGPRPSAFRSACK
jgi:uncharacterized membrane protein